MTKLSKLTNKLKAARESAGLTQMEVADKLGYSTSQFISNWERGLSAPPLKVIKSLAGLYGIPMEEIFDCILEITIAETESNLRKQFKMLKRG